MSEFSEPTEVDLKKYFSDEQWDSIGEYEKRMILNQLRNYEVMKSLGFSPAKPYFMSEVTSVHTSEKKRKSSSNVIKQDVGLIEDKHLLCENGNSQEENKTDEERTGMIENLFTMDEALEAKRVDCMMKIILKALGDFINIKPKEKKLESPFTSENIPEPVKRYPKRNVPIKNYTDVDELDDDDYIFCDSCNKEWEGDCPEHGPLIVISDTVVVGDNKDPDYALKTTPPQLTVTKSKITGAGRGVWTRCALPARVRFGPYAGEKVQETQNEGYCWQIKKNKKVVFYIDGYVETSSNWMRYVNCARHKDEQNVLAYQYKGEIYYRTFNKILENTEILVWYGAEYGIQLGITTEKFKDPFKRHISDFFMIYADNYFPCVSCNVAFSSVLYLESHWKYCKKARMVKNFKFDMKKALENMNNRNNKVSENYNLENSTDDEDRKKERSRKQEKCIQHVKTVDENVKIKSTSQGIPECERDTSSNTKNRSHRHYICENVCGSPSYRKANKQIMTDEKTYTCDVCNAAFSQISTLTRHKRKHTGENPYICDICNAAFSQISHLKCHKRKHTGEKPYICDICNAAFSQNSHLTRHKRKHTGEKPYICDICNAAFSQNSHLKCHKRKHTGEKPYICEIFNAAFTDLSNLTCHKRTHTGEKPYICEICNAAFSQISSLTYHKRKHTGENPYICDICNAAFSQISHLKCHKRKHTGEKPYICDICNAAFSQNSHLTRHKRKHTGEKPYICEICNAAFTDLSNLTCHKRTHTGEKPYICEICNAAFSQISSLTYHKRKHTGEKPYICDICNAAFSQSGNLKCHKRKHTGEKPYICEICNAAFTNLSNLKCHKRKHTG